MTLDDGKTSPAQVRRLAGATIELTIHEGRNRQVQRMIESVGHRVKHLHRSRYGPLTLKGLEPGAWRELEPSEVERLRPVAPAASVCARSSRSFACLIQLRA